MIYVQSSGRRMRSGLRQMVRRGLFRLGSWLLRLSGARFRTPDSALQPYHLDAQSCFDRETRARLEQAAEDFQAALAGLDPVHARWEGGFTDGGTTVWQGDGYQLRLLKSLTTVGEVHGYMYGPVLDLEYPLAHGNTTQISQVCFYTWEELERLVKNR